MKPQSSTGICIGDKALPIWGICPVRKGNAMHKARQRAAFTTFLTFSFFIIGNPFLLFIWYPQPKTDRYPGGGHVTGTFRFFLVFASRRQRAKCCLHMSRIPVVYARSIVTPGALASAFCRVPDRMAVLMSGLLIFA